MKLPDAEKCVMIFGAGNIGCGFIGQLVHQGGLIPIFVDINPATIQRINTYQGYRIFVVDNNHKQEILIRPAYGFHIESDRSTILKLFSRISLVATAVGSRALPYLAPLLAEGIASRLTQHADPLHILVAENLHDAARYLGELIRSHLSSSLHAMYEEKVGIVDTVIGRMVPVLRTDHYPPPQPLTFHVEPYSELPINGEQLCGPFPSIPHILPVYQFSHYTARKLYIHNCGHAVLAYLGFLKKYIYIHDAVQDEILRSQLLQAWEESIEGIRYHYGCDPQWLRDHSRDLLSRFGNYALQDTIVRIARDPLRKLQPEDRLVAPAKMAYQAGTFPFSLLYAIAAAFHYNHPEDPQAVELQSMIRDQGFLKTCEKVTGWNSQDPFFPYLREMYEKIREEYNVNKSL